MNSISLDAEPEHEPKNFNAEIIFDVLGARICDQLITIGTDPEYTGKVPSGYVKRFALVYDDGSDLYPQTIEFTSHGRFMEVELRTEDGSLVHIGSRSAKSAVKDWITDV